MDETARLVRYAQATARICEQAPVKFLLVQPPTYGVGNKITWHARGEDWVRDMDAAS